VITCEPGAVFNRGLTCVRLSLDERRTLYGAWQRFFAHVPVWLGELPAMQHEGLPCGRATSRVHTGQAEKRFGRHNQRACVVVDSDDARCVGLENETDSTQWRACGSSERLFAFFESVLASDLTNAVRPNESSTSSICMSLTSLSGSCVGNGESRWRAARLGGQCAAICCPQLVLVQQRSIL
jgi:hypothetical protein